MKRILFKLNATVLALATLAACAPSQQLPGEGHGEKRTFSSLYPSDSAAREAQSKLFVQNTLTLNQEYRDQDFIGKVAIALIDPTEKTKTPLALRTQDILTTGAKTIDAHTALGWEDLRFTSPQEDPSFTSFNLALAVSKYKQGCENRSCARAKVDFEKTLSAWTPQIIAVSEKLYHRVEAQEFRETFDRLIRNSFGPSHASHLNPNAPLRELARPLSQDGELVVALKELLSQIDLENSKFGRTDAGKVLRRIQSLSLRDIEYARDRIRTLREPGTAAVTQFQKLEAGVDLAGMFIDKLLHKPEDAKRLVVAGHTAIKVAKTVTQFQFGEISAQLAAGNYLGAASSFLSSLAGLDLGPDLGEQRHQEIMDTLEFIRTDIAVFKQEMIHRFDQVDHRLNAIDRRLYSITEKIDRQLELLTDLKSDLLHVKGELRTISASLANIEIITQQGFSDLMEDKFHEEYALCLGPVSLFRVKPALASPERVSDCLSWFFKRAMVSSLLPTRTGVIPGAALNTSEQLTALRGSSPILHFGLLVELVGSHGLANIAPSSARNPADWVAGAESFLQMAVLHPDSASLVAKPATRALSESGRELRLALLQLGRASTLRGILNLYKETTRRLLTPEGALMPRETVLLFREMLDQAMALTRNEDRFENSQIRELFEGGPQGLLSAEDLRRQDMPLSQLESLRSRNEIAIGVFENYLEELRRQKSEIPASTLVDATVGRLELLSQANEARYP